MMTTGIAIKLMPATASNPSRATSIVARPAGKDGWCARRGGEEEGGGQHESGGDRSQGEDRGGHDHGPAHGKDDLPERTGAAGALDQRRFLHLPGEVLEVRREDPDAERQGERRIDEE